MPKLSGSAYPCSENLLCIELGLPWPGPLLEGIWCSKCLIILISGPGYWVKDWDLDWGFVTAFSGLYIWTKDFWLKIKDLVFGLWTSLFSVGIESCFKLRILGFGLWIGEAFSLILCLVTPLLCSILLPVCNNQLSLCQVCLSLQFLHFWAPPSHQLTCWTLSYPPAELCHLSCSPVNTAVLFYSPVDSTILPFSPVDLLLAVIRITGKSWYAWRS